MVRLPQTLTLVVGLGLLGFSFLWLSTGWYPTGDDELTHLQNAVNVAHALQEDLWQGLGDAWRGDYAGEERARYWPGALYLLSAPFIHLFSTHLQAPLMGWLVLIPLFAWATMKARDIEETTTREASAAQGVWALWWVTLTPSALILSRHYLPSTAAAVGVTVALWGLIRGQAFKRLQPSLIFGLATGLALMADRLTAATFLWLPLLLAIFWGRPTGARVKNALAAGGLILIIAGPFYWQWLGNWGGLVLFTARGSDHSTLLRLLELMAWLPDQGLGWPATATLVASGAAQLLRMRRRGHAGRRPALTTSLAIAAFIAPWPLLVQTDAAQNYMGVALLAPLGILAAPGIALLARKKAGRWILVGISCLALTSHAFSTLEGLPDLESHTPWRDHHGPPDLSAGFLSEAVAPPQSADQQVLALAARYPELMVVDLIQEKGIWAGLWVHYLLSVKAPERAISHPLRRDHAAFSIHGSALLTPCDAPAILLIHPSQPWTDPSNRIHPIGTLGMKEMHVKAYHQAMDDLMGCFAAGQTERGPMGGFITALHPSAPPDAPPPTSQAGRCPTNMAQIDAGEYPLGDAQQRQTRPYLAPEARVSLPAFCMDQYEYPNQAGTPPRSHVSWQDANLACQLSGKRLCTEPEWAAACRGEKGRRHAYGDSTDVGRCHTDADPALGEDAILPSASHPDCHSPEGVFDLDGSLSEWTATAHPGPPFPVDGGSEDRTFRILKGGTMWPAAYGEDCLSRHWHAEDNHQEDDGFRCCLDLDISQRPASRQSGP